MCDGLFRRTTPLALTWALALMGCGIPRPQYKKQVAKANRLEAHLKQKMERIDYLEAKEKAGQQPVRRARAAEVARMARLAKQLSRVGAKLHKKQKALAACRATRVRAVRAVPVRHKARVEAPDKKPRFVEVRIALEKSLLLQPTAPLVATRGLSTRLRRALGKTFPPMAQCLGRALRKLKKPRSGALVATLRLDRRGRAKGVKVVHKSPPARRAARCVKKGLRSLELSDPPGAIFVAVPLRFRAAPRAVKRITVHRHSKTAVCDRVLRTHRNAIQLCFISSGLPASKLRKARVKVAFSIDAAGKVGPVRVLSSVLKHAALNACIQRTLQRIRFPKPDGVSPIYQPELRWRAPRAQPRTRRRRHRRRRRRRRRR